MDIKQILVSEDKYSIKCPYEMQAEFIVVHNTANDASAENEIKYMISNNDKVSFHYAIDDKEIVQGIPENRNSWNAGDGGNGNGNRKGIAVEICYSKSGGDKFIQAEKNAAKFIAKKLKEKGWGIDKVKKHQDFSNKYCPHRTLDLGWDRFISMIKEELGESKAETSTSNLPNLSNYNGQSIVDGLNSVGYDSSFASRKILATQLGISNYTGTAEQNLKMINLLKGNTTSVSNNTYFKNESYNGSSIVEALNQISVDSSYSYRNKLASKSGISNYKGTASQNTQLLNLLKQGKLIKV